MPHPMDMIGDFSRLTREKRVVEAQTVLDDVICNHPEFAAQWYIMARLLLGGGEDRQKKIQDALKGLGMAPAMAFQQSIQVLEETDSGIQQSQMAIHRLHTFLSQLKKRTVQDKENKKGEVSEGLIGLNRFLQQVRSHKMQKISKDAPSSLDFSFQPVQNPHGDSARVLDTLHSFLKDFSTVGDQNTV